MDHVWKHSLAKSGDLLVQLAIADYADDDGNAYPSIPALGKKSRLSDRQVKRSLRNLEHLGELKVLRGKGPHGTNRYRLSSDIMSRDKLSRGVTSETGGGDIYGKKGVTPMSPNPSEETIRRNRHSPRVSGFERFWETYPRKMSKGDAEKAWKVLAPDEELQSRIGEAIERAKNSAEWRKDGGRFIPYPATWLRAKGWEDELVPFALPSFPHSQLTNGHSLESASCIARYKDAGSPYIKTCGKPLMPGEKYCSDHALRAREAQ
jgi:hypothetical protein